MRKRHYPLLCLLILAACGGGQQSSALPASDSPGPALVVERFLQAANANDLETMSQLFGTPDRTIVQLDGRRQAEERMYVLASLLRHSDWSIEGQRTVPGRMTEATELVVRIRRGPREAVVPIRVVRRSGGGWIIERIDVEPLTTMGG